ncbi:hypothetical protein predicted by Glimmer/Critica [Acetobacter senegalensis]|uniref:Uncharacterized protein n=1 Tax=Acetobacter senegalensis TaxID=446692 RepID=A0A0U5ESA9_9PROT|nr:hypothetical protein predicted by Glimmer/Critica [Acetobacter senegalensis]
MAGRGMAEHAAITVWGCQVCNAYQPACVPLPPCAPVAILPPSSFPHAASHLRLVVF